MRVFDFLRRLFGKNPGAQEGEERRSAPSASAEGPVVTPEDEELKKRFDRFEQEALERIRKEAESDLQLPPAERMKKGLNLATTLAVADRIDCPFPFVQLVNRAGVVILMDQEAFD